MSPDIHLDYGGLEFILYYLLLQCYTCLHIVWNDPLVVQKQWFSSFKYVLILFLSYLGGVKGCWRPKHYMSAGR